jgi:hypothetical protein
MDFMDKLALWLTPQNLPRWKGSTPSLWYLLYLEDIPVLLRLAWHLKKDVNTYALRREEAMGQRRR